MSLKNLIQNKKTYWKIESYANHTVITCPICGAWFTIPNALATLVSYHFCPGCGKEVEAPPVYALVVKDCCDKNCEHLFEYEEEGGDGAMGYCQLCYGKRIGTMDEIRTKECECVLRKGK